MIDGGEIISVNIIIMIIIIVQVAIAYVIANHHKIIASFVIIIMSHCMYIRTSHMIADVI